MIIQETFVEFDAVLSWHETYLRWEASMPLILRQAAACSLLRTSNMLCCMLEHAVVFLVLISSIAPFLSQGLLSSMI
jgi:hypothetical protein